MQVPPPITAARAAILAAQQHIAQASFVGGSEDVVDALSTTRSDVQDAAVAQRDLSPTSRGACVVLHALEGLRAQLDDALQVASALDPDAGRLPIGTVDPVFDVLEDASGILFASRWG